MTICNDHDQEVCYESRDCPACLLQEQLDAALAKIESLKEELDQKES